MLLVPSATRVMRTDLGADDLMRRLAPLLPDGWLLVSAVGAKPVSDICDRGHTRPFDAIVIGERTIFVVDIWSESGLIADRRRLFGRSRSQASDDGWQAFRRETEKLKALLHDRFDVEPGRIVPEKIWSRGRPFELVEAASGASNADLRSFARAASACDKAAMFHPLPKKTVERIAGFLTQEAKAAPKPVGAGQILYFSDGSPTAVVVDRPPVARMPGPGTRKPVPAEVPKRVDASPPLARPVEAAAAPAQEPPAQIELAFFLSPPVLAPPEPIPQTEEPAELILAKEDALPPLVEHGAYRRAGIQAQVSSATAAEVAPAPRLSDTAMSWAEAEPDQRSASLAQVALAAARGGRPPARWGAVAMLLLVSQAGAIAWLTLGDESRRPIQPAPAAKVARTAPVAIPLPAPAALRPAPFVVRALASSEPMLVGSETVTLRAGPSPEFSAVGNLQAGTSVLASATARGPGDSSWLEIKTASGAIGFVPDSMLHDDPESMPAIEPLRSGEMVTPKIERAAVLKKTPAGPVERALGSKKAPAPKIERAVASKKSPRPKIQQAAASTRSPTPKVERAAASKKVPAPKVERALAPKTSRTPRVERAAEPKEAPVSKIERAVASKKPPAPKVERAVASNKTPAAGNERSARLSRRSRPAPVPAALEVDCILPGGEQIQATRTSCRARSGIIYQ